MTILFKTSKTMILIVCSGVPPFSIVSVPFSIVSAPFLIENDAETIENNADTIENGAETKHLNSTRTARPPRAWQFKLNSNAKEELAFNQFKH